MMYRAALVLTVLGLILLPSSSAQAVPGEGATAAPAQTRAGGTSCITCHGDAELFDPEDLEIVEAFANDVHANVGLSCHDCHGGNPDPALWEDYSGAKDETLARGAYRGAPDAQQVPEFCGRCHSDPGHMRRFRPDARVDQVREYWTSQHGQSLRAGDTNVATCVDCHGIHGIRRVDDRESLVHATNVATTCNRCHGDAARMASYTLPGGLPLPVDQYARWRQSVHADAMLDRGDVSAPTCNDCHGNHGAMPPGVDSLSFVCGQCHGREAEIFRGSPKHEGLQLHNEYLADVDGEGCIACHEPPEPQAIVTGITSFSECATCHGNHAVVRPTIAMLVPLPDAPCAFCHEGAGSPVGASVEPEDHVELYLSVRDALIEEVNELGLSDADRFDWLVDQALSLEFHTLSSDAAEGEARELRPEFEELFTKFRIGRTAYAYTDPTTGESVDARVQHCNDCHPGEAFYGGRGLPLAEDLVDHMRELTSKIGQAERILLGARRGGVETRDALLKIEQAVNAQIELEVLVHGFSTEEGGEFLTTHAEGVAHADAALAAGESALQELVFRRRWLVAALIGIVALLIGIGLKIREMSAREREAFDTVS